MFNLNSMTEKVFCMKSVQINPVLGEKVAAVKNSPHQHRGTQTIDKTANEAHLQRMLPPPQATAGTPTILTSLSDPNLCPFSTVWEEEEYHAQITV
jgi:hypothetical protein